MPGWVLFKVCVHTVPYFSYSKNNCGLVGQALDWQSGDLGSFPSSALHLLYNLAYVSSTLCASVSPPHFVLLIQTVSFQKQHCFSLCLHSAYCNTAPSSGGTSRHYCNTAMRLDSKLSVVHRGFCLKTQLRNPVGNMHAPVQRHVHASVIRTVAHSLNPGEITKYNLYCQIQC